MRNCILFLKNPMLWICGGIIGFGCLFSALPDIRYSMRSDYLYFYDVSIAAGVMIRMLPLITALSYGLLFTREWENGYYHFCVSRSGILRYWFGHTVRAYLSGVFATGTGFMLFLASSFGIRREIGPFNGVMGLTLAGTLFGNWIASGKGWIVLIAKLFINMAVCGVWPVMSCMTAVFFHNRYISLLAPFGICIIAELVSVQTRWIFLSPFLSHMFLFDQVKSPDSGVMTALAQGAVLMLICSVAFLYGINRRLLTEG